MLPIMAALLSRDLSKEVNLQRYASFLLFSLAGLLFRTLSMPLRPRFPLPQILEYVPARVLLVG